MKSESETNNNAFVADITLALIFLFPLVVPAAYVLAVTFHYKLLLHDIIV